MRKFLVLGLAAGLLSSPAIAQEEVVKITLKDGDLGFKEMTVKGEGARFDIENAGTVEHGFELEGEIEGKKIEIGSAVLKPGEKATLIVDLPAGKYEAYCPVDDHKAKGMSGEITFGGN